MCSSAKERRNHCTGLWDEFCQAGDQGKPVHGIHHLGDTEDLVGAGIDYWLWVMCKNVVLLETATLRLFIQVVLKVEVRVKQGRRRTERQANRYSIKITWQGGVSS
jgi:hypothetical protein